MKVFVTGGTGYIGSEVVRELLSRGHQVLCLARDPSRVPQGATPVAGTLEGSALWIPTAAQCDAIVHCAFDMGAGAKVGFEGVMRQEADVCLALSEAAKNGGKTSVIVITTSVSAVVGQPGIPDEYAATDKIPEWTRTRFETEAKFLASGTETLRMCSVRPSWVYGGKRGFIGFVCAKPGPPVIVGDGSADVSFVEVHDLARLYAFIIENPKCRGPFHGVSDMNFSTWREISKRISALNGTEGRVDSLSTEEAFKIMGPFANLLVTPLKAGSKKAQELGFSFKEPRIVDALERFYKEFMS